MRAQERMRAVWSDQDVSNNQALIAFIVTDLL